MTMPDPADLARITHHQVDAIRQWLRDSGLRPARSNYRHAIDLCDLARGELGPVHSSAMAAAARLEGFPVRITRRQPAIIGVSELSYQHLLVSQ